MKYLMLFVFLTSMIFAQVDDRMIVNEKDLPPDLVRELKEKKKQKEVKEEISDYSEYIGMGKEIGMAISEGLKAVVTEAEHFGNTNVGLFTMIMIAWSIIGIDIVQILLGIPIYFVGIFLLIRYYRLNYSRFKMVKSSKGFFLWATKEYELVEPNNYSNTDDASLTVVIIMFIWTILGMLIIFS